MALQDLLAQSQGCFLCDSYNCHHINGGLYNQASQQNSHYLDSLRYLGKYPLEVRMENSTPQVVSPVVNEYAHEYRDKILLLIRR